MPFKFELVSPERLVISGEADQVVVPGSEGDFTVLPGHAPVLSTLRPGVLAVTMTGGASKRVYVRGGFAEVDPTSLTVLAQQAVDVAEVDRDWAEDQVEATEKELAGATDDEVRRNAYAALEQLRAILAKA